MNLDDLPPKFQEQARAQMKRVTPKPAGQVLTARKVQPEKPVDLLAVAREASVDTFFLSAGIPKPTREHRFDPVRRWRFDYCWPDERVALEVDGGVWTEGRHTRGQGFLNDREKDNAALLLGWRVFHVQPSDLITGKTAEMLREAMRISA